MGYYRSEREAAYAALRELQEKVPFQWDDNGIEWGMTIYRAEDSLGNQWYTYMSPSVGEELTWKESPPRLNGWVECAMCHTHPNDTGFSWEDKELGLRRELTIYIVTQSGAYLYEGKWERKMYGINSHPRHGTMWGLKYPWSYDDPTVKVAR